MRVASGLSKDPQLGWIILVDKPYTWTSFDVVNKLRYCFRTNYGFKKIKIGHAGTLDPLATGLLIVCVGKETKNAERYMAEEKEYTGCFRVGETTPSYDAETSVDEVFPERVLTMEELQTAASSLEGQQWQIPPVFSAKKIDGRRAYVSARKGQNLEIPPSNISIMRLEIRDWRQPEADFYVKCSKGTYIRALARDFGLALNSGAWLRSLRRVSSGGFRVENALTLEEAIDLIKFKSLNDSGLS
jgi:tRNA pseudouridine55 synthase